MAIWCDRDIMRLTDKDRPEYWSTGVKESIRFGNSDIGFQILEIMNIQDHERRLGQIRNLQSKIQN